MGAATPHSPSSPRFAWSLATWPVWLVGVLAAALGAVVAEAFTLAARAADVPMDAAGVWETVPQHIAVGYIARSVMIWSIGGIVLAVVLARKAKRPVRPFVVTTVVFATLSLAAPALAVNTPTSTKLVLVATHVLAAAVIIAILARRLAAGDGAIDQAHSGYTG